MMRLITLLLLTCILGSDALSDTFKLPVTQDNSIVMVDGEWSVNAGSNSRIRIKGNQHIVAMSFDLSGIAGKMVKNAALVCEAGAETISAVTISTIATPWNEVRSTGLTAGIDGIEGWGYPGARFPAVTGSNAFTLVHQTRSEMRDGKYFWNLPADMIHAMTNGVAFGLAVHEHEADYRRNPTIFSREQSRRQPYLIVETNDQTDDEPLSATDLKLIPIDGKSARVAFRAPLKGFAYEVSIDGKSIPRHNIPLVAPGTKQAVWLRDLPDSVATSGRHKIDIVAINRMGKRSKSVSVQGTIFSANPPELPRLESSPATGTSIAGLAVIPATDKYDEVGRPVGELPEGYRTQNALFDGQRIRLTAAAGEVVGFQAILRGDSNVSVECKLDAVDWRVDLFKAVYVPTQGRRIPDPLLPLPEKLPLRRDKDQAVYTDLYVPFEVASGRYVGRLEISDGRSVPIELTVLPVSLPRKASFLCEMNGYGLPDHVDDYYALQQVAYDHRVHANILHYSHRTAAPGARKSNLDMRLSSGRRMDNKRYDAVAPGDKEAYWDDFAEAFGPLLDGSCFRGGHRGPIPPPGFYLTFHESWPLHCRAYFNGNPDAFQAFVDSPVYPETYVNVLADFARLARSKKWMETGFQVYFNNKGSLNDPQKSPWILDEPTSFWDYRALQYYGELTDRGRDQANVHIDYRVDISRPEF
ncbi:MAG: hypothetical protein AAF802_28330, partial [Planctomycetota bacterium]